MDPDKLRLECAGSISDLVLQISKFVVFKGENMFMKKLGVAAVLILCAVSASASNFRGADQVYIPAAGHAGGASGTFISDVYISNLSSDEVDVNVIYQAAGQNGGSGQEFPKAIKLRGFERKEYLDFFQSALGLSSGFGQLIFNACKKDADCTANTQDQFGVSPNFRPITVSSRIYQIPNPCDGCTPPNTRQTGQLFTGIPWYGFVSSLSSNVGLDKVFITGLTQTGGAGQVGTFRANVGVTNASQWSKTTVKLTLYQGTMTSADKKAEKTYDLGPLGSIAPTALTAIFGDQFTGSNFFVVVEQTNNVPCSQPGACPTQITVPETCVEGCPAFLAYGSVLDNASGDATTQEAQYLKELSQDVLDALYPNSAGKSTSRRSVRH